MILVYSPKFSKRITYTMALLLGRLLGAEWQLTSNLKQFGNYEGPKINYSTRRRGDDMVHIPAHGFLMERGIREFAPELRWQDSLPLLFPATDKEADLPFDVFAAAFYLVSRYEEYLPHRKDVFGRFEASESYAFQNGFLHKPVVNHYAAMIRKKLQEKFPEYSLNTPAFTFIPTYDIDVAYAYKGRAGVRSFLGAVRSLAQFDFTALKQRIRVLSGAEQDPFDSYDKQIRLYKESGIKAFYFFLVGDYGPYDRNLSVYSSTLFSLIKKLGDYAHIGIHPSYASNKDDFQLEKEIRRLSEITHQEIRFSRQHYLRLNIPQTFHNLLKHNITYDFTMGYASQPGFRAGICSPYPFYDLAHEHSTPLTIIPFAIMDGTLRDYLQLTPEESLSVIKQLIEEVAGVGGTFVSLWHNDALCDYGPWKGWQHVYDTMYKLASEKHEKNYDPIHQT